MPKICDPLFFTINRKNNRSSTVVLLMMNKKFEAAKTATAPTTRTTKPRGGSTDAVLMMNTNFEVVNIQEFDILLTDIKGETIRGIEINGVKHLSEVTSGDGVSHDDVLHGVTFGTIRGFSCKPC
mmetsp:Transcript_21134/g.31340  ORF Transcript_21134/g.31340 Transcript_21134/m.31340 type:complete len:125 (+) Transcript_21134:186-560(+)